MIRQTAALLFERQGESHFQHHGHGYLPATAQEAEIPHHVGHEDGAAFVNGAEVKGVWAKGAAYDPYMGRWSRLVAADFVKWLDVPHAARWLDVGCGTGALSQTILEVGFPKEVVGMDQSQGYLDYARHHVIDRRLSFRPGDAHALSSSPERYDAAVSGLALNFMVEPHTAVAEMVRVTNPGGIVAAYVWDYADRMELLRYFWDTVFTLNPQARSLDEAQRSTICTQTSLARLFTDSGLENVMSRPIDVTARFSNFDDYWLPFLGGQGTVASYAMSLSEAERKGLRDRIRARLPIATDGSISMTVRAWAVKGRR